MRAWSAPDVPELGTTAPPVSLHDTASGGRLVLEPGWRWSDTMYGAVVTRSAQAVAGEMSKEDAFTRIDSDVAEKVKASGL